MAVEVAIAMPSVAAEEQHEQLRRFVDEWTSDVGPNLDSLAALSSIDYLPCPKVSEISTDPIALTLTQFENASVQGLVHTAIDNTPFAKLMTVTGFLCTEIELIRSHAEARIFPSLIVFGERPSLEEIPLEGDLQVLLAQKLPLLLEASLLFKRLRQTLQNLVLQLGSLYPPPEPSRKAPPGRQVFASFRDVQLGTALEGLGAGFSVLAMLDEIVAWNGAIAHAFMMFKRMLETVRSDPGHFSFEGEKVGELDRALEALKGSVGVLAGGMLRECFTGRCHPPFSEVVKGLGFLVSCDKVRRSVDQSIAVKHACRDLFHIPQSLRSKLGRLPENIAKWLVRVS
jgi:hypothetical protein